MRRLLRTFIRSIKIFLVASRYFLIPLIFFWRHQMSTPLRLRLALQALGGAWIKLGQALALRFDLLPAEYCSELFNLLNKVEPFSYAEVREVIKHELGNFPEILFLSFESEPFGAASIGQVHRATLPCGTRVAVKVQRPGITESVHADITLMAGFASVLDFVGFLGGGRIGDVVDEFARWTEDELDYSIEARHAVTLAENARGDKLEKDPFIFDRYCSVRVLTMELIVGIPVIDIMNALRDNDAAYLTHLREQGYDLDSIASHITWNTLNQIYRQGYFHADPHPANMFIVPGNAIAYVDFGIVGELSDEIRESLGFFARSLFAGNVDRAADEYMRWIVPSYRTDVANAREDLKQIMSKYLFDLRHSKQSSLKGQPSIFDNTSVFEIEVLSAIRRHQLVLAPEIVTYLKTLLTAEAIVYTLAPKFDLQWHENRFFGRMLIADSWELLDPQNATRLIFDFGFRVQRSLEAIDRMQRSGQGWESEIENIKRKTTVYGALAVLMGTTAYALMKDPAASVVIARFLPLRPAWQPLIFALLAFGSILAAMYQVRKLRSRGRVVGGALPQDWYKSRPD